MAPVKISGGVEQRIFLQGIERQWNMGFDAICAASVHSIWIHEETHFFELGHE